MSGAELVAVVGCIAAVVSAYNDGSDLVRKVRERRRQKKEALQHAHSSKPPSPDTPTQELERSLISGKDLVQHEYDRRYRRFGVPFAQGDQEARDILKNIIIDLQGQVIRNLKIAVQEDTSVNVLALQDVSDESQDKAILCLMQLHQRLLVAAPITQMTYSDPRPQAQYPQGFIEPVSRQDSWATQTSMAAPQRTMTSTLEPVTHQELWAAQSAIPQPLRLSNKVTHQNSWITQSPVASSPHPSVGNMEQFPPQQSWAPPTSKYSTFQRPIGTNEQAPHQEPWAAPQPPIGRFPRSSSGAFEYEQKKPSHNLISGMFHRKHRTSTENSQSRVEDLSHQTAQLSMSSSPAMPPVPPKDNSHNTLMSLGYGPVTPPQHEEPLYNRTRMNRSRPNSVSTRSSSLAGPSPDTDNPYFDPWKNEPSPRDETDEPLYDNPNSVGLNPDIRPDHDSALGHRSSQSSNRSWASRMSQNSNPARHNSTDSSNSWRSPIIPTAGSSHRLSQASQLSSMSTASQPVAAPVAQTVILPRHVGSARGYLPNEENDFAGFCKGAWRLQIGERKKAIVEANRPQMVSNRPYWKCKTCHFEGRMTLDPSAKNKKSIDTRVYGSAGILYRWELLFKCHVKLEEALPNPLDSTFGCIFCCAEGKGTPLFGTVKGFLAHMQEHRERVPSGEVMYRVRCIVGRIPTHDESFDIALPPR